MVFRVEFSARAERDLARLLEDSPDRYTARQSLEYVIAIRNLCRSLDEMPQRQPVRIVSGRDYRRFRHGGHVIYYVVFDAEKRVSIEAVLRGSRDFRRYL